MDVRKWMKRVLIFAFFIVLVFLAIRHIQKARYENSLINPDVVPAFIQIENHALLYVKQEIVFRKEYDRCKSVVEKLSQDPSPEKYYTFLLSLGFDLPPYKLSVPPTKEQKESAKREASILREEQIRIMKMQTDQALQQIKEYLRGVKESLDK
jgi:hypothetical protein